MRSALVLGAGGFIGNHLVAFLKRRDYWVRAVDLCKPGYGLSQADEFIMGDLRDPQIVSHILSFGNAPFDEIYQLAADMGGAGYIFTGEHDADIMHNSALINLNLLHALATRGTPPTTTVFYSSSACIYPEHNQLDPSNPDCAEATAYPANPDSEYGWEKLFSERMYLAYARNHNLSVRIARFHNIYGPEGTWQGGREKAPAAICRKVIAATTHIDIWGDGLQTRSFLYIDECLEGIRRLMDSPFAGPFNIGSDEMVTLNELVAIACSVEGKTLRINHLPGPTGVRGRTSDNTLIKAQLGWAPNYPLRTGIALTYNWIKQQMSAMWPPPS